MKVGIFGIVVVIKTIFSASIASAAGCLAYEPAIVTIQGSVTLERAYGPPGYGEDPKHDAREDYLALTLDPPACVTASSSPDSDDVAETNIRKIQLVFKNGEAFQKAKKWIKQRISVTGSLFHAITGHHHTAVLLELK